MKTVRKERLLLTILLIITEKPRRSWADVDQQRAFLDELGVQLGVNQVETLWRTMIAAYSNQQ